MISQRCPKCRSLRIRKGYKPTPLLFRLVGIHHLLCNHCNLLFTGFAVPWIPGRNNKKARNHKVVPEGKRSTPELFDAKDTRS